LVSWHDFHVLRAEGKAKWGDDINWEDIESWADKVGGEIRG